MEESDLRAQHDAWHATGPGAARDAVDPRDRRFFRWVLSLLPLHPAGLLLDLACGRADFLQEAQRDGVRAAGVDLSEVALRRARSHNGGLNLHAGNGQQLPFRDGSFDYVTCPGSLEHFPDPEAGAREICRVLRPDGTAVIFVPNLFFLGHVYFGLRDGTEPSEGYQQFSEMFKTSQGWVELLDRAGLRVLSFHPWNRIFASKKVSSLVMTLWNGVSPVVPVHGAYAFAFVCRRG